MKKAIATCASTLLLAFFSTVSPAAENKAPDFVELQAFARLANASYGTGSGLSCCVVNRLSAKRIVESDVLSSVQQALI